MTDREAATTACPPATKDTFLHECTATALASPDWPGQPHDSEAQRDAMLDAMHAALARVRLGLVYTNDPARVCGPNGLNLNSTNPGLGLGDRLGREL